MGLNSAIDISTSAINAERLHMELITSNLANINTTRASGGGTYRRKIPVYSENQLTFDQALRKASNRLESGSGGVNVHVVEDAAATFQKIYNPGHPDADADGYVTLPNVSLAQEMTDLVYTSKLYEANITVFNATKKMGQDTLQIQ